MNIVTSQNIILLGYLMENEDITEMNVNKTTKEAKFSPSDMHLERTKVVLEFVAKCFYPAICILVIILFYPKIAKIDLEGLVARLHSAKAGDVELAFTEKRKEEGEQYASINGKIEELKRVISDLNQDIAALKKATPTAILPPEQAAIRKVKDRQFEVNSAFTVLVFYKPYQKDVATRFTAKLLSIGFKSSATPTDLKEAARQFDENKAWVLYTERGKRMLPTLKAALQSMSHKIDFTYRDTPYPLRNGDIQILMF